MVEYVLVVISIKRSVIILVVKTQNDIVYRILLRITSPSSSVCCVYHSVKLSVCFNKTI